MLTEGDGAFVGIKPAVDCSGLSVIESMEGIPKLQAVWLAKQDKQKINGERLDYEIRAKMMANEIERHLESFYTITNELGMVPRVFIDRKTDIPSEPREKLARLRGFIAKKLSNKNSIGRFLDEEVWKEAFPEPEKEIPALLGVEFEHRREAEAAAIAMAGGWDWS